MTAQLQSSWCGQSKRALQEALDNPGRRASVNFVDPSPFGDRWFTAADIKPGESFPCVLDPQTRRRFAKVARKQDGTFKVS